MNINVTARRPYRQGARAAAAEATAQRILDAFETRIREGWLEEISLDQVAADAGVTVSTIVRKFGGKAELLAAIQDRLAAIVERDRKVTPEDLPGAVQGIVDNYERIGDLVLRALAQEARHAAFQTMNDVGRKHHRAAVVELFARWLQPLSPDERTRRIDALVIALDVYAWKILRRDLGRSPAETARTLLCMVEAILAAPAEARS